MLTQHCSYYIDIIYISSNNDYIFSPLHPQSMSKWFHGYSITPSEVLLLVLQVTTNDLTITCPACFYFQLHKKFQEKYSIRRICILCKCIYVLMYLLNYIHQYSLRTFACLYIHTIRPTTKQHHSVLKNTKSVSNISKVGIPKSDTLLDTVALFLK